MTQEQSLELQLHSFQRLGQQDPFLIRFGFGVASGLAVVIRESLK
jgi:hypothetical protein